MHSTDPSSSGAHDSWSSSLRARFLEIAVRRVPRESAEDLVQDALAIIYAKHSAQDAEAPPLRWCFQVLRNVIGNWYQKKRRSAPLGDEIASSHPDPLAALTAAERTRSVREAMHALRSERAECARWLWDLARGVPSSELARRASIEASAFYRRVYRCRQRLREILATKGVRA